MNLLKLKCGECAWVFSSKYRLQVHSSIHLGIYRCMFRQETFNPVHTLFTHYYAHIREKPYFCSLCDKTFTTNGSLRDHILSNTGEKSFSCNSCRKSFTCRPNLKTHQTLHIGKKKFKCGQCEKNIFMEICFEIAFEHTQNWNSILLQVLLQISWITRRSPKPHSRTYQGEAISMLYMIQIIWSQTKATQTWKWTQCY